jgi:hypothetical protein
VIGLSAPISGRGQPVSGQFAAVVDGAEHRPFAGDLGAASQQELAEAAGLLDLAEDRRDGLFAQAAGTVEAILAQLGAHLLDAGGPWAGLGVVGQLTTPLSAGGDEAVDFLLVQGLQIGVGTVAGVGGKLRGLGLGLGWPTLALALLLQQRRLGGRLEGLSGISCVAGRKAFLRHNSGEALAVEEGELSLINGPPTEGLAHPKSDLSSRRPVQIKAH